MQALQLRSFTGWRWVTAGWGLFRKQPFSFAALLFFYWLLLLCASAVVGFVAQAIGALLPFVSVDLVAAIGSLIVAVLTPTLTVGFLQACRTAAGGLPVHPLMLFAPFRAGRQTLSRLLMLGAVQMVALMAILFVTSGLRAPTPNAAGAGGPAVAAPGPTTADRRAPPATGPSAAPSAPAAQSPPTAAQQEEIRREAFERVLQGFAYLPVALLMWYAPMLVAWHRVPPGKALFFSLVAVWRNKGAFVVYAVGWLSVWLGLSIVIALVTGLFGIGNLTALIAAPLVMLLLTCMYCSVYPTYATVFVDPVATEPPPVT